MDLLAIGLIMAVLAFFFFWLILGFWLALQFVIVGFVAVGLAASSRHFVGTDAAKYFLLPGGVIGFLVARFVTQRISTLIDRQSARDRQPD